MNWLCAQCGGSFPRTETAVGQRASWCPECVRRYQRDYKARRRSGLGPLPRPHRTAKAIRNDHRYKLIRAIVFAEESDCGICGERVDKSLPGTDRMGPHLDHIVPLAVGGAPFERTNCRLAHSSCNAREGQRALLTFERERTAFARAASWLAKEGL